MLEQSGYGEIPKPNRFHSSTAYRDVGIGLLSLAKPSRVAEQCDAQWAVTRSQPGARSPKMKLRRNKKARQPTPFMIPLRRLVPQPSVVKRFSSQYAKGNILQSVVLRLGFFLPEETLASDHFLARSSRPRFLV
ncbi:hypothetical protein TNCV_1486881 [Trichonephila clavipes]|nr:hypothetical protein TNCV_1486881 [Trichonephila clavipes]